MGLNSVWSEKNFIDFKIVFFPLKPSLNVQVTKKGEFFRLAEMPKSEF